MYCSQSPLIDTRTIAAPSHGRALLPNHASARPRRFERARGAIGSEGKDVGRQHGTQQAGRLIGPEEHWQWYKPQLQTWFGQWKFWLPNQGSEARKSFDFLRRITPKGDEEESYELRHDCFRVAGDLPISIARGTWDFSRANHSLPAGILLPYYDRGFRVLCLGYDDSQEIGGGSSSSNYAETEDARKEEEGDITHSHTRSPTHSSTTHSSTTHSSAMVQLRIDRSSSKPTGAIVRANVCFMDGPHAQLNVAFSERSASLRQEDLLLQSHVTQSHVTQSQSHPSRAPHIDPAARYDNDEQWSALLDGWVSPHWLTPLPASLPSSLPPLPSGALSGTPCVLDASLMMRGNGNMRQEDREEEEEEEETKGGAVGASAPVNSNEEPFKGFLAGLDGRKRELSGKEEEEDEEEYVEAENDRSCVSRVTLENGCGYQLWALPRGVVVAVPDTEVLLSNKECNLVVTWVQTGQDGHGVEGLDKVQQLVITYDAFGNFSHVSYTMFT